MAKTTRLNDKVKIKGIRRRWLVNSVGIVVLILILAVSTLTAALSNYYYSDTADDLEKRASSMANGAPPMSQARMDPANMAGSAPNTRTRHCWSRRADCCTILRSAGSWGSLGCWGALGMWSWSLTR